MHSILLSAFVSTALLSAEMAPDVQLAGISGMGSRAESYASALTGKPMGAAPVIPVSATKEASSSAGSSSSSYSRLGTMMRLAKTIGIHENLNPRICASVGVGDGVNRVPVWQVRVQLSGQPVRYKDFNLVKDIVDSEGKPVILIAYDQDPVLRLYKTTPDGYYRAASIAEPIRGVRPLAEVDALFDFYMEIDWWLKNAGSIAVK